MTDRFHELLALMTDRELVPLLTDRDPALLFDETGSRILWANAAALEAMDERSLQVLRSRAVDRALASQIAAISGSLREHSPGRLQLVRFPWTQGFAPMRCRARRIGLAPSGGILVICDRQGRQGRAYDLPTALFVLLADLPVAVLDEHEIHYGPGGPAPAVRAALEGELGNRLRALDSSGAVTELDVPSSERFLSCLVARIEHHRGPLTIALFSTASSASVVAVPTVPTIPAERHAEVSAEAGPCGRFRWTMDSSLRFTGVTGELELAVGKRNADIVGHDWDEIAGELALDNAGGVARALRTRDTWSGEVVRWPADAVTCIAVDLAGFPVFGPDGAFEGYRGFGICRPVGRFTKSSSPPGSLAKRERLCGPTESDRSLALHSTASSSGIPATGLEQSGKTTRSAPSLTQAGGAERMDGEPTAPERAGTHLNNGRAGYVSSTRTAHESGKPTPRGPQLVSVEPNPRQSDRRIVPLRGDSPLLKGVESRGVLSKHEREAFREIARSLRARLPRKAGELGRRPAADRAGGADTQSPDPLRKASGIRAGGPREAAPLGPNAVSSAKREGEEQSTHPPSVRAAASAEATEPHAVDRPPAAAGPREPVQPGSSAVAQPFPREPCASGAPDEVEALLARLPSAVLLFRDDQVLFASRAFLDLLGYRSVEEFGSAGGVERLLPGESGPHHGSSGDAPTPLHMSRGDGSSIPVRAKRMPVQWRGVAAVALVIEREDDGAARLLAAEQQVDELRAALDTASDGLVIFNGDGSIERVNRSAEALIGFDAAELIGRSFVDLFTDDCRRPILDKLDLLMRSGTLGVPSEGHEATGSGRGGRPVPMFLTIGRIGAPNASKFCAILRNTGQGKRAEPGLIEAKQAAEEASARKSEFLTRIGHEIRTPLNAILGFSEIMMEERFGPLGNDRYKACLSDIHASGTHVVSLIDDLLSLSKIEAGRADLTFTSVSVNEVVQQCAAIMQPQANRNRVIIRTSFAATGPTVIADQRSLRQIVLNLLSNSIRFTREGGQVIVSTAVAESGSILIRVRDTGVGMSKQDLRTALEPFRQVSAPSALGAGGTGLGLPLTKALVEANGASFAIESNLGVGTLVEITFPSARAGAV